MNIEKTLQLHKDWLWRDPNGVKADLSDADLSEANLCGTDLYGANLCGADLCEANLCGADLCEANLCGADLCEANLRRADLRGADLRGADLRRADLRGADLREADLRRADLPHFTILPMSGSFICWKKGRNEDIIKLKCPAWARRTSSLIGRKGRIELGMVLEITDDEGRPKTTSTGKTNPGTVYTVGQFVSPDSFDPDIRVECSNGIHVFLTKKEAEEW